MFERFWEPCTTEQAACHKASETSMMKSEEESYAVERNGTRSHDRELR